MLTARRSQRTIARESGLRGVSLLSGLDVSLRFRPAQPNTGVVFVRSDLPGHPTVPAHVTHVIPRQRRTTIQRGEAVVEMVEHVLAALAGLRIDNCLVEIDGAETPGCDGSSQAFVEALQVCGVVEQAHPRQTLVIDRPVTVQEGGSTITAHPGDPERLVLSYNLDYGDQTPIGRQSLFVDVRPESFRKELAPSRTFLLEAEANALREAGIGRRTTEADLLIFGATGVIGNELRYADECVRHKILDMLGDLALLGHDIAGHVVAHRSGHQLNAALVRKLIEAIEGGGPDAEPAVDGPVFDIRRIMQLLPHRYPFLLLDRVLAFEPGLRVHALKNVTSNEPFFQGHWPGRPIMPGVLIIEALAQAAGILIGQEIDRTQKVAMLVSLNDVKLRRPVVPGDQLHLEIEGLRLKDRSAEVLGVARVEGQVAAEAKIRFVVVDANRAA